MVKVVVDDLRGLVQSAGSGCEIKNGSDLSSAQLSVQNASGTTPLGLKTARELITVVDDATTSESTASFIPADSLVVAAAVSVITASAGGNNVNITDIGTDGDPDLFNETAGNTLDINTAGGTLMGTSNAKAIFSAADKFRVTHGDVGTQSTDAVLAVTIWYYDLSVATGS